MHVSLLEVLCSPVLPRRFGELERSDLEILPSCDLPLGIVGSGRITDIWTGGGSHGIPSVHVCACRCRTPTCSPCMCTVCRLDMKRLTVGLLLAFPASLVGMWSRWLEDCQGSWLAYG